MQLCSTLDQLSKGTSSIFDYMVAVKSTTDEKSAIDELLLLNASIDIEEITLNILNGLGDDYQGLANVIKARDTAISFEELHDQ